VANLIVLYVVEHLQIILPDTFDR